MAEKLAWGLLATGNIAKAFAKGLAHSKTGKLVACASRDKAKSEKFGAEFGCPKCYGSYEELLADKEVQAVYISTPHPMHAEWAIKTAEAGKHILCEKPIGMNHPEAMAIVEAARRNNVFVMEAFMYRCHPQTAKLVELLKEKVIGEVKFIHATFSFQSGFNPEGRLWKNELGGGGILDVGCYPVSMARLIAGVAKGKPFAEPIDVKGVGVLHPETKIDAYAAAVLKFPGDILATVATGVGANHENGVRVFGHDGWIFIPSPWIPAREGGKVTITVKGKNDKEPREIAVETGDYLYGLEADTVAQYLEARGAASPAMSPEDTLGNMLALDRWRESIGLVYECEKPEKFVKPLHGRPLARRKDAPMKYGTVKGLGKQVSRLVMGVDNQRTFAHAAVMFDDFFEQGGNCFDTAYIYGGGHSERLLGQWIRSRNLREQVVLLDKGAHTPHCNPKALTSQLLESLDRTQAGYVDIYMMHRDNPEIPVAEFCDVLNEHVRAGRIKVFGGSNWSLERVEAFNAYAVSKGLQGMSAVSNNFSLARMVDPVWGGCIAASDPKSRAWLEKHQLALMPWSSQARGFFTERAGPDKREDGELVRCWYSDDNFQRRDRAFELAKKKGVLPINIALAYVLCQPFPTFPLIGPRILNETTTSLPGLGVELTAQEVKWLNLEA
ncbi:MAG: aldo/keto reductase [Planctomycetota bacterium]|nr:aldo/keto reductase [Planctomycetota bacterium]